MHISVVVPIYNGESYIEQCVNSLLSQSYQNFELILIDDGSTDQSGAICDKFAEMDSRIKVIHKKNAGLIAARITGVTASSGKYIAFVDADDWVENCFIERLLISMKSANADIVISGCIYEQENETVNSVNRICAGIYEGNKLVTDLFSRMLYYEGFYEFGIMPYMCNKLFCKEALMDCYQDIDMKIYDGEDAAVFYPYMLGVKRAVIIDDCLYHYRIHNNSMTFRKREDFYENVSRLYLHLSKRCKKTKYYGLMLPQLEQYLRRMVWLGTSRDIAEEDRLYFPFRKVSRNSDIILYGAGFVGRIYYQQIKQTGYCNIVSWVDQNNIELSLQGLPVEGVAQIAEKAFDYVVIANLSKKGQEAIKWDLIHLGIKAEQIVMGEEAN